MINHTFRILVISLFIISGIKEVNAQLKTGIKAGINYSDLKVTSDREQFENHYSPVLSFHAGGFATYLIAPKIFVNGELLFSQTGFRHPEDDTAPLPPEKGIAKINHLSIPVLLGFNMKENLSLSTGLSYSHVLSSKDEMDSGDTDLRWYAESDIEVILDLNYMITKRINTSLRYSYGLISRATNIINPDWARYNSQLLQLSVGYQFN